MGKVDELVLETSGSLQLRAAVTQLFVLNESQVDQQLVEGSVWLWETSTVVALKTFCALSKLEMMEPVKRI